MKKNITVVNRLRSVLPVTSATGQPGHFNDLRNVPGGSADYIRGIDISHHNTINDWNAIKKAGVRFVYIKIAEGVGTPDPMAQKHALVAKQNGLTIGYYHFGRPDKKNGGTVDLDATAEATAVKNLFTHLPAADLPLMLDLENSGNWDTPLSPAEYLQWVEKFLRFFVNPANPLSTPLIYSRKEYLDAKLPPNHTLGARYKLWLSRYTGDYNKAVPPKGWAKWHIWQFTEKGVLGSNGSLDLNIKRATE